MTPNDFLAAILDPGLAWCAALSGWHIPSDDRARVLMLAIAGQESNWTARVQGGNGPAHSFWQMERMGGVNGVLSDRETHILAYDACAAADVPPVATNVWGLFATEKGDNLAVAFARLLLWSDPTPIPAVGNVSAAANYYRRNWRPGKYRPNDWPRNYGAAVVAVNEANLKGKTP
jgi:hypothetical protein